MRIETKGSIMECIVYFMEFPQSIMYASTYTLMATGVFPYTLQQIIDGREKNCLPQIIKTWESCVVAFSMHGNRRIMCHQSQNYK